MLLLHISLFNIGLFFNTHHKITEGFTTPSDNDQNLGIIFWIHNGVSRKAFFLYSINLSGDLTDLSLQLLDQGGVEKTVWLICEKSPFNL